MIGAFARTWDSLLGRGEAAVTVPPLDGALRPNRLLDEVGTRFPLPDVDCLAVLDNKIVASAGHDLFELATDSNWQMRKSYGSQIASIACFEKEALAIALVSGEILIEGGRFSGQSFSIRGVTCITALVAQDGNLFVANGSAIHSSPDWQQDLMSRGVSGSIWCLDIGTGQARKVADGLSWPAGLALDGEYLVVSEAWKNRLMRLPASGARHAETILADFPGYPGRISRDEDGYWLASFAPRSQLVEFVLREPGYRKRMMAEVPRDYWIAPTLRSGRSFYEPLQGGSVKRLGMLKPWAPTMSAGLCVRLDHELRPRSSLHSRADGTTHGVTSVIAIADEVFIAAKGDGVVVQMNQQQWGGKA